MAEEEIEPIEPAAETPNKDISGRAGAEKDPLHGITLKEIVIDLVDELGWEEMGYRVKIRCFTDDPSVSSSLKFLRKTPWAREKVERLYLRYVLRL